MIGDHAEESAPCRFVFRQVVRRVQCLGERTANIESEGQRECAKQEGDAPAIFVEMGNAQRHRQNDADAAADHARDALARALPRCIETALPLRRGLDEIGRGGPDFATKREALQHPRGDREDRRDDADAAIGRDQRQSEDGKAHQSEAEQHRRPAADAVGVAADDQPADRDAG